MSFVCPVCVKPHEGLCAWAYKRPDYWLGLSEDERAAGKCDDDLCRTPEGHFFVRCVMELPLVDGSETTFELGPWGSLSEVNFWRYVETYDDQDQSKIGSMFSYLSNEVAAFPGSRSLHADLRARDNGQRPLLILHESDHPLAVAQREGIPYQTVLDIIHRQGAKQ